MISNVILGAVIVILIVAWLAVRLEDAEKKEYKKIIWITGKILWFTHLIEDQTRRRYLVKQAKDYLNRELWIGNCTSRDVRVKLENFLRENWKE